VPVTGRIDGLEQQLGAVRIGDHLAVAANQHVPRGRPDVDPVVRVARVRVDRVVLLEPAVHRRVVDLDVAVQCLTGRAADRWRRADRSLGDAVGDRDRLS
jgi:hypothetical protein